MSYYAPKYGFVCDQVDNFQLVLASGEVVDANAMDNPDLWSALKGGSNNFGVVTRFDLKTFIQGKIWGGTIVNTIDTLPAQVGAFTEFNNATDFDTNAAIINTYGYTSQIGAWAVSNLLVYTANVTNPPVLRPFTDIKPQLANTMRLSKLSDITSEQVKNAPTGLRYVPFSPSKPYPHPPKLPHKAALKPSKPTLHHPNLRQRPTLPPIRLRHRQ